MRSLLFASACAAALLLNGCARFSQVYHFQTAGAQPNYFRVKVEGDAETARARFLAGFYDERAVDLYFNELKPAQGEEAQLRRIFVENQTAPGEDTAIKPLSPDKAKGVFVMIFSTNPKAVADTIGSFAQSQIVADGITNLLNRREVEAARTMTATRSVGDQSATAVAEELKGMIPAVPADNAPVPPTDELQRKYLRTLEAIARVTGGPPALADFKAARAWLGRAP